MYTFKNGSGPEVAVPTLTDAMNRANELASDIGPWVIAREGRKLYAADDSGFIVSFDAEGKEHSLEEELDLT